MQTLLKCVVAASLAVFLAQTAGAAEYEHRHYTHEGWRKYRTLPLNFHHGDPFKALEAGRGFKAHFEGRGGSIFARHSEMHHLSAQQHL